MKVLHCIHSLRAGGAEKQLNILLNSAKNNDEIDFAVFCVDSSNDILLPNICKVYEILDNSQYPLYLIQEINRAIKEFEPDIVHCWLPHTIVVSGLISARFKGIPVVSSYRNSRFFNSLKDVVEFFFCMIFADAIVSNCNPQMSNIFFQYLFKFKNNRIIPNAVDVPEIFKKKYQSKKINDFFIILYVGRLVPQKNLQVLLKALYKMKSKKPFKLLICGTGEEEDEVKTNIKKYGLTNNVEMLGFKKDIYSLMASSDLLVLPSIYEGMPNVVLEALSIGLPCVVSSIPAHTNLLNDDIVRFFNPSSSQCLAEILDEYIEGNIDLLGLTMKGMQFSEKFSTAIQAENYLNFYQELLEKNKTNTA